MGGMLYKNSKQWKYDENINFYKSIVNDSILITDKITYDSLETNEILSDIFSRSNTIICIDPTYNEHDKNITPPKKWRSKNNKSIKTCTKNSVLNAITPIIPLNNDNDVNVIESQIDTYIISMSGKFINEILDIYLYMCKFIYSTEFVEEINKKDQDYEYFNVKLFNDLVKFGKIKNVPLTLDDISEYRINPNYSNNFPTMGIVLHNCKEYKRLVYTSRKNNDHDESKYLKVMENILKNGIDRNDRTGVGTRSLFGIRMEFSLSNNIIPILTTKRILWKKVIGELLWFLSGSTSIEDLHKNNIHFWDANSTKDFLTKRGLDHYEEGDVGPIYGFQWRHWGAQYEGKDTNYESKGIDQLKQVINLLINDPFSRRIILSSWNVSDLSKMSLPPCHLIAQFYVREEKILDNDKNDTITTRYLDCQLYQRSGDMFLGVPFNIASYSILVRILCKITGYNPGKFIHIIGDAHIYNNHFNPVLKQLKITPRPFPKLHISNITPLTIENNYKKYFHEGQLQDSYLDSISSLSINDFTLENYICGPFIYAPMAI